MIKLKNRKSMEQGILFFDTDSRTFYQPKYIGLETWQNAVCYEFPQSISMLSKLIETVIDREVLRIELSPERLIQVDGEETYCLKVQTKEYSFIIPDKKDLASALNELLSLDRKWRQQRYVESQQIPPTPPKWSLKRLFFSFFSKFAIKRHFLYQIRKFNRKKP